MGSELIITSTMILVPFAAASQQINHWISSRNLTQRSHIPLSSTPRDITTFIRGARAMSEILLANESVSSFEVIENIGQRSVARSTTPIDHLALSTNNPPHHAIRKRIIQGSRDAMSHLHTRLNLLCARFNDPLHQDVSACRAAFKVLESLSIIATAEVKPSWSEQLQTGDASSEHATGWLDYFVRQPCKIHGTLLLPTEPLTRFLLSFYAQIPQAYLDLVLPLLDQRLESPVCASSDWYALSLTQTQTLALDIYAHWSVLMFLVKEDSWWIGNLPEVTLTGLVNRYGTGFVRRLWPECVTQAEWWPGEILQLLQDVK
jgi:hypothetical protein